MKALRMVHCKDDQNGEEYSSQLKNQPPSMFRHVFPPFSPKRGAPDLFKTFELKRVK